MNRFQDWYSTLVWERAQARREQAKKRRWEAEEREREAIEAMEVAGRRLKRVQLERWRQKRMRDLGI